VGYLDANRGFHGAMFQLTKGQGQVLGREAKAKGVRVTLLVQEASKQSTQETKNELR
jgi:hypothetical protein